MDIILCEATCANPEPKDLICPLEYSGAHSKVPSELPIKCISVKVELVNKYPNYLICHKRLKIKFHNEELKSGILLPDPISRKSVLRYYY